MGGRTYGWVDGRMGGWVDRWMDGWVGGHIDTLEHQTDQGQYII